MGTRRPSPVTAAALAGVWLMSGQASAVGGEHETHDTSPFWQEVRQPGGRRARSLARQAMLHVNSAGRMNWRTVCLRTKEHPLRSDSEAGHAGRRRAWQALLTTALTRRAHLDSALVRLQAAHAMSPEDPEILFVLAMTLAKWEEPGPLWTCRVRRRDREAADAFRKLIALDPQHRAADVSFELGIVLMRAHDFAAAADAYARGVALALDTERTPVAYSNLAEAEMLAGRLERAVTHYDQAIEVSRGGLGLLLPMWGKAVALDRLGEYEAALEAAGRALRNGGGRMGILRYDDVFFEPEHEIHYYEALGYEAAARGVDGLLNSATPEDRERREQSLRSALEGWRHYAEGAGPDDAWRHHAESHIARVEELLKEFDRTPRRAAAKHSDTPATQPPRKRKPAPI